MTMQKEGCVRKKKKKMKQENTNLSQRKDAEKKEGIRRK